MEDPSLRNHRSPKTGKRKANGACPASIVFKEGERNPLFWNKALRETTNDIETPGETREPPG